MLSILSSLSAQMGTLGLAIVFFLCIRSTWLDYMFIGLSRALWAHHSAALISIFFIIIHISIETWDFGFTIDTFWIHLSEMSLFLAWMAFFLYGLVIVLAKKRNWHHRIWKRVHLLSLPAWIFTCYHVIILVQPGWTELTTYLSLTFGTLAIIYTQILPRTSFWGARYNIKSIKPLNCQVCELTLQPVKNEKALTLQRSAQYFYLRFNSKTQSKIWHPFTCLSQPGDKDLVFAIKAIGKDTRIIRDMSLGQQVNLVGPFGHLRSNLKEKEIWLVGGVGVTPLLSVSSEKSFGNHPVRILHAVDNLEDQIYEKHWQELTHKYSSVEYQLWVTNNRGYVNIELITTLLKDFESANIFIAGPDPFIAHVRNLLSECGVLSSNIHTEEFVRP